MNTTQQLEEATRHLRENRQNKPPLHFDSLTRVAFLFPILFRVKLTIFTIKWPT